MKRVEVRRTTAERGRVRQENLRQVLEEMQKAIEEMARLQRKRTSDS